MAKPRKARKGGPLLWQLKLRLKRIERRLDTELSAMQGKLAAAESSPEKDFLAAKFSPDLEAELTQMSLGLESLSERARQVFLNRFNEILAGLSECELVVAPVAGKDVCELQFPTSWISELRAAAACAHQIDAL